MSDFVLAVLMRWPRLGEGKTRLAAQIGAVAAHQLHRRFVLDTLAWPAPRPRVLAVSPGAAVPALQRLAPDATVVRQEEGGLGGRIAGGLRAAFARGAGCAVLVGTDSPSLPNRLLTDCMAAASRHGAAMVPADDGGFVALALTRGGVQRCGLAWLHSDIAWSSERAAADTCRAAQECGVDVATVAPWYDVDTAADLRRLHADLRRDPQRAARTLRWLDDWTAAAAVERAS